MSHKPLFAAIEEVMLMHKQFNFQERRNGALALAVTFISYALSAFYRPMYIHSDYTDTYTLQFGVCH